MLREVTNLPSLPAKGELLTWKVIDTVGSSTESGGKASTFFGSQIVSEICNSSMPVTQTMSPADADSMSIRSKPW